MVMNSENCVSHVLCKAHWMFFQSHTNVIKYNKGTEEHKLDLPDLVFPQQIMNYLYIYIIYDYECSVLPPYHSLACNIYLHIFKKNNANTEM